MPGNNTAFIQKKFQYAIHETTMSNCCALFVCIERTCTQEGISAKFISGVLIAFAANHPRARDESSTIRATNARWDCSISSCDTHVKFSRSSWNVTQVSSKIEIILGRPGRRSRERSSLISYNFLVYECTNRFTTLWAMFVLSFALPTDLRRDIHATKHPRAALCRTIVGDEDACVHMRARTRAQAHRYIWESANLRANKLSRAATI